jgi:endoglucanase
MDIIHENMTYYCTTFVAEARKRGFSTFIWDNNAFGSGMEKFGIFDRERGMKIKADWIIKGVMQKNN